MGGHFGGFESRACAGTGLEFFKLGGQGREQFLFGIDHRVILRGLVSAKRMQYADRARTVRAGESTTFRETSMKLISTAFAASLCLAHLGGLAAEPKSADKPSQQGRMKTCNADAKSKSLKGDDRKTFMSQCLKAK